MAGTEELARELSTVVNSAYPVSLQRLALICSRTDVLTVRACIRQLPPCAIARLVSNLCDALPLWQCCVDILLCLSHSLEFKHELLSRNPSLLDALLTKANASEQAFHQYHDLCVVLLSHPLPEAVPLPASVQSFFLRVFEEAAHKPDVQTLKPIYYMLDGACRGLLSLLPPEANQSFDKQLCRILGSNVAGDNSFLLLWCFGIVMLAEHPESMDRTKRRAQTSTASTVNWSTTSGRKLFESENACKKTITLACLSVIWAVKGGVGISDDDALQGIRIATSTLQFVDQRILDNADLNGLTRNSIPKLLEKIQCSTKPAVQREALCFYAMIRGPSKLPPLAVQLYEAALASPDGWNDLESQCSLRYSLPLFANRMHKDSVRYLLSQILNANTSPISVDQAQNSTILANAVAATAISEDQFCTHMATALSDPAIQKEIEAFLAVCVKDSGGDQLPFCRSHSTMIRQTCLSATISMLLTIILNAGTDRSLGIPSSLGVALIEKQHQLAVHPAQCTHSRSSAALPSVSLFEQECTPMSRLPLQDWKGRLTDELQSHFSYQRDSLVRAVSQICHDLENRCDTIETPLREERQRCLDLEAELSRLRAHLESLEQKRVDDSLFLGTLEGEKHQLEKVNDELSVQVEHLRAEIERSNSQANSALHEAEEAYTSREAQLKSTILQHEQTIGSHQEELDVLRNNAAALNEDLRSQETKFRDLASRYDDLQTRFEKERIAAEERLNEERQSVMQKNEEITRFENEVAGLERELRQARTELATTTHKFQDLQTRHHELAQSSTKALQEVEAQYEIDLEAAACQAAEELKAAQDETSRWSEAYERIRRDLEQMQSSIPPLHTRIQELVHDCRAKNDALEQLRSWKNGVFKSMGLPPESVPIDDRHDQHAQIDAEHAPDNAFRSWTVTQDITDTAIEHVGNISVSSRSQTSRSGSTSKRHKSQPSSKGVSVHPPYNNGSAALFTTPSQAKRSALRAISPNRRHTTAFVPGSELKDGKDGRQSLPLRKRRVSMQENGEAQLDSNFQ